MIPVRCLQGNKDAQMIQIEFEKPKLSQCDCCGNTATRLTRYVYQNGDAFAVYFIVFTKGHEDKVAHSLIGMGDWGADGTPEMRTAFALNIWDNGGSWGVTLTDKEESPWNHVELLGEIIDREEALSHASLQDVYHITDHIVAEDRPLIDFFE